MINEDTLSILALDAISDIVDEFTHACSKFGSMSSAHEGYAVLLEEVDELWDHVKMKQFERDMKAMRKEAVQIAAMALKFIVQVCQHDVYQK